jgi:hypothetical protein
MGDDALTGRELGFTSVVAAGEQAHDLEEISRRCVLTKQA